MGVPAGQSGADAAREAAQRRADAMKEKLGEIDSWESIGRTGWQRVETEKGFRYFYHKKKKKTSWECPKEIAAEVAELDGVLGVAAPEPAASAKAPAGDTAKKETADAKKDGMDVDTP